MTESSVSLPLQELECFSVVVRVSGRDPRLVKAKVAPFSQTRNGTTVLSSSGKSHASKCSTHSAVEGSLRHEWACNYLLNASLSRHDLLAGTVLPDKGASSLQVVCPAAAILPFCDRTVAPNS